MKNLVMQSGNNITVAAPRAVASGEGVLVGSLFGVASTIAAAGVAVALSTVGVYNLAKTAGQVFTVGAPAYWDDAARTVTAVAAGNTKIGVAIRAAAGPDATAQIRLNGSF